MNKNSYNLNRLYKMQSSKTNPTNKKLILANNKKICLQKRIRDSKISWQESYPSFSKKSTYMKKKISKKIIKR